MNAIHSFIIQSIQIQSLNAINWHTHLTTHLYMVNHNWMVNDLAPSPLDASYQGFHHIPILQNFSQLMNHLNKERLTSPESDDHSSIYPRKTIS